MVAAMTRSASRRDLHLRFSMYQYAPAMRGGGAGLIPTGWRSSSQSTRTIRRWRDVIADWKKIPGTGGIRIMMTKEAGREPTDPGLDRILRAAVAPRLPVNMLCWGNLDAGMAIVDRHPETRFITITGHTAAARTPRRRSLADLPKGAGTRQAPERGVKVSGACTLSREPYPFPGHLGPACRVFDAWGFRALLAGARMGPRRVRSRSHRAKQSSPSSRPGA